ncbi:MAG TPA: TIGR02679 family protein [Burkholderiales bacterium]|nr:TIGR02679 family protein [Burkholderiales bacterium]
MNEPSGRLERLLGGPGLAALRKRLRQRYELARDGDSFTLSDVTPLERRTLEGLLARPAREARSIRLSVAELDQALARAGIAGSLREALSQLDGPVRDRLAERIELDARWEDLFRACRDPRIAALVAGSAGRGLVKRLSASDPDRARALLESVDRVLEALPRDGAPLSHLAADLFGDAHALDEGKAASTATLAALRQSDAERPREIWARHGVLVGELVCPALALNLEAARDTAAGALAEEGRTRGEPVHLSLRALLRHPPRWAVLERDIFVCENPAVVAVAADRLGTRSAPLVCTEGMPSAAQRVLLSQLSAAGARLHYHGDFDWPGIVIGNFVMRSFDARPWQFDATHYLAHVKRGGRELVPPSAVASWDPRLSDSMSESGLALEEEVVIDSLMTDLVP